MQRFEALKLIDVKTEGKIFHIENLSDKSKSTNTQIQTQVKGSPNRKSHWNVKKKNRPKIFFFNSYTLATKQHAF